MTFGQNQQYQGSVTPPRFDDLTKLDKPNLDWVITEALTDVRRARSLAYSDDGKIMYIHAVSAIIEMAAYYWILDPDFKPKMVAIDIYAEGELMKIADNDNSESAKLNLGFEIAQRKFRVVMESIVKSTKTVPVEDYA